MLTSGPAMTSPDNSPYLQCAPCFGGKIAPWTARLLVKVDFVGPFSDYAPDLGRCWIWRGASHPLGYGTFRLGGDDDVYIAAHRAVYELLVGPIPAGLHLDHLCRVPACVNPDHLDPVTVGENNRRSLVARGLENHCRNGHEYTLENTYYPPNKPGRMCRICHRLSERRRLQRLRDAGR